MRTLYTLLISACMPMLLCRLYFRSWRNPAYRQRIFERFGVFAAPKKTGGIWVHAVSVGEVVAAVPLVQALLEAYSDLPITVTTMTPTGSERVQALLGERVHHVYAPYDIPFVVKGFLNRVKPKWVVIMETELWPNTFNSCYQRHIPIVLANARLSPSSFQGYKRFQKSIKQVLNQVTTLIAQSKDDGERFLALGLPKERLQVAGNIKFDISIPDTVMIKANELRKLWGEHRPVWIAASTHEGEEEQVLDAFHKVRMKVPDALLIMVPRHPERFEKAATLAKEKGFHTILRTESSFYSPQTQVYIGNTMGELLMLYGASDVAFVGGSLIPHGGHNLLEPAALQVPAITGPHVFNFAEINRLFCEADAVIYVSEAEGLADRVINLLQDKALSLSMGEKGYQVVEQNRGALGQHMSIINTVLH